MRMISGKLFLYDPEKRTVSIADCDTLLPNLISQIEVKFKNLILSDSGLRVESDDDFNSNSAAINHSDLGEEKRVS